MTSEINGLPPLHRQIAGTGNEPADNPAAEKKSSESASGHDQLSLTDTARQLQALQDQVKDMPTVDSQRVDAIKAAIADGSYQVDANRIAEKMISMERSLDILA